MEKTIKLNPYQKIEIISEHSNGFEFRVLQKGMTEDWQVMYSNLGQKITVSNIDEFLEDINEIKGHLEFMKNKSDKKLEKKFEDISINDIIVSVDIKKEFIVVCRSLSTLGAIELNKFKEDSYVPEDDEINIKKEDFSNYSFKEKFIEND